MDRAWSVRHGGGCGAQHICAECWGLVAWESMPAEIFPTLRIMKLAAKHEEEELVGTLRGATEWWSKEARKGGSSQPFRHFCL